MLAGAFLVALAPVLAQGELPERPEPNGESGGGVRPELTVQAGRVRRYPPHDASARDASFLDFKNRLSAAAASGDRAVLTRLIAPRVQTIEAPSTPESLLDSAGVQPGVPWVSLLQALSWGVAYEPSRGSFWAPYYAIADLDAGEFIVMGRGVRLRESAVTGRVIRKLSFEVVRFEGWASPVIGGEQWAHVRTGLGELGYVSNTFIPADERFVFERVDGVWKLTAYGFGN